MCKSFAWELILLREAILYELMSSFILLFTRFYTSQVGISSINSSTTHVSQPSRKVRVKSAEPEAAEVLGGSIVPVGKTIRLIGWTVALQVICRRCSSQLPSRQATKSCPTSAISIIPLRWELAQTDQTQMRAGDENSLPNKTRHDNSWSSAAPSFFAASWPPYQIF